MRANQARKYPGIGVAKSIQSSETFSLSAEKFADLEIVAFLLT
jgi:hypothetical protein